MSKTNYTRQDARRIADQHAEAALCHIAHVAGIMLDDEVFEIHKQYISSKVEEHLVALVRRAREAGS